MAFGQEIADFLTAFTGVSGTVTKLKDAKLDRKLKQAKIEAIPFEQSYKERQMESMDADIRYKDALTKAKEQETLGASGYGYENDSIVDSAARRYGSDGGSKAGAIPDVVSSAQNTPAAAGGGAAFRGGEGPIDNLAEVSPTLRAVVERAQDISKVDFGVLPSGGKRDKAMQGGLKDAGWTGTMDSEHLKGYGIDLVPMTEDGMPDQNNMDAYGEINRAMSQAMEDLGVRGIEWGGTWNNPDRPHYQIDPKVAQQFDQHYADIVSGSIRELGYSPEMVSQLEGTAAIPVGYAPANGQAAAAGAINDNFGSAGQAYSGDAISATVDRIIGVESNNDPNAKNSKSTATGLGQFIEDTWMETVESYAPELMEGRSRSQVLALRRDPEIAREMTTAHTQENAGYLQSKGHSITPTNLYLAHFLGKGGANKVLNADPNTPMSRLVSRDAIEANDTILEGKTAGQVRQWAQKKMKGVGGTKTASSVSTGREVALAAAQRNMTEGNKLPGNGAVAMGYTSEGKDPAVEGMEGRPAPRGLLERLWQTIDPEGKMGEAEVRLRAFEHLHQHYIERGMEKEAADAASDLYAYLQRHSNMYAAAAKAAAQSGNMDDALEFVKKYYANVPDGYELDVQQTPEGSYQFRFIDVETKEVAKEGVATPEEALALVMQMTPADATEYVMAAAAGGSGKGSSSSSSTERADAEDLGEDWSLAQSAVDEHLGETEVPDTARKLLEESVHQIAGANDRNVPPRKIAEITDNLLKPMETADQRFYPVGEKRDGMVPVAVEGFGKVFIPGPTMDRLDRERKKLFEKRKAAAEKDAASDEKGQGLLDKAVGAGKRLVDRGVSALPSSVDDVVDNLTPDMSKEDIWGRPREQIQNERVKDAAGTAAPEQNSWSKFFGAADGSGPADRTRPARPAPQTPPAESALPQTPLARALASKPPPPDGLSFREWRDYYGLPQTRTDMNASAAYNRYVESSRARGRTGGRF